jgi:hypothetical protein
MHPVISADLTGAVGSYWRSLRRADRIALVTLLVTVVLGLLAVVPAYLAFFSSDDAGSGAAAGVRSGPGPAGQSATTGDDSTGSGQLGPAGDVAGSPAVGDTPGTHVGRWKGSGTQGGDSYPIYLDIAGGVAGAKFGDMYFPVNGCRFDLILVDVKGPVITMQAKLVTAGQCGGARATLTAEADGSLKYVVPNPDNPTVAVVVAPLYRYTGAIPGA